MPESSDAIQNEKSIKTLSAKLEDMLTERGYLDTTILSEDKVARFSSHVRDNVDQKAVRTRVKEGVCPSFILGELSSWSR